jgi:hypothetical protein
MIKDILTPEVTIIIVTAVILPFLVSLSKYFCMLLVAKVEDLQKKIENDKINNYIDHAQDAITTAVDSITQTFVKTLKENGTFTKDSAKDAFNKAKKQALYMISDEAKEAITSVKGDVDFWVENKIEAYIKKQSSPLTTCPTVLPTGENISNPTPVYIPETLQKTEEEKFVNPEVLVIDQAEEK